MAKNLRDRGYSSSMDDYKQDQKKKQKETNEALKLSLPAYMSKPTQNGKLALSPVASKKEEQPPRKQRPVVNLRDKGFSSSMDGYNTGTATGRASSSMAPISTQRMSPARSTETTPISEAEFNRSSAMQRNYGTYQNYLNGKMVTGGGYYHTDAPDFNALQTAQNNFNQARMTVMGKLADAERKLQIAGEMKGTLRPDQEVARANAVRDYQRIYSAAEKITNDYFKVAGDNDRIISQYMADIDDARSKVRNGNDIQAEYDDIERQISALNRERSGLQVSYQGGKLMEDVLAPFSPAASADALSSAMNASERVKTIDKLIEELRAKQALLQEEMQISRDNYWSAMASSLPDSVKRAADKSGAVYQHGINIGDIITDKARYLTDEEKDTLERIVENYGTKKGKEYYDYLSGEYLNTRRRRAEENAMRKFVGGSDSVGEAAWWLDSVLLKPLSVLTYAGQMLDYLGDGRLQKDAGYNRFSYLNTAIRSQVQSDFTGAMDKIGHGWKKYGDFGYQVATSTLDFLYNWFLSAGIGTGAEAGLGAAGTSETLQSLKEAENLSLMLMGTEVAADTIIQAKDRGLSDGQAIVLGNAAGVIEIFSEKVSVEQLLDGLGDRNAFAYLLKNFVSEGSEEGVSSLMDKAIDVWVSKDQSEWRQAIRDYKYNHPGASDEEALKAVWSDAVKEIGTEMLAGGVSGLGMGFGFLAGNNYMQNRAAITSRENVSNVIRQADGLGKNSAGYKAAQSLQAKLDTGENISVRDVQNAMRKIDTDRRTSAEYVQARIADAEKYTGTEAATKAALLQEKIDRGESVSYRDVVSLETANDKARATSSEYLSPLVEIGKANAENSPAYKAAVKVEQKLQSGQDVTVREAAQLERATNKALNEAIDSKNADVIGSYMISESGRKALTDAATILKNSTARSDVQRGNEILQAIKDGNLDAKTAGEVFLRSQKILENTRNQTARVLQPREVTADMDAYDRSAAKLGVSEEEAAHNKAIMQAFGVDGEYKSFENNNLSAYYDRSTGKVYINANAQNPGLALIAHEVTHSFENTAAYKKLQDLIFSQKSDLNAELDRIQKEYADSGIDLDADGNPDRIEAKSELVSEFVEQHMFNDEKFINDVVTTDRSLGQKVLRAIDNLLAKLGNKDAQQRKLLRDARDLWAKALQQRKTSDEAKAKIAEKRSDGKLTLPTAEAKAAAVRKTEGANLPKAESRKIQAANAELNQYSINIDADSGAAVSYSIRTAPTTVDEIKLATDRLVNAGFDRADAESWLRSLTSVSSVIMQNMLELDYEADERYTWLKTNSEYTQGSVDFNNNCPKRAQFTAVFDRLQQMMPDRVFSASDYEAIRQILIKHQIPVTCGPCFVEDRRQHTGEIAQKFIDQLKSGELKNKFQSKIGNDTYIPTQYDLVTYEGLRGLYDSHRGIHDAFVAFNNARGMQAARLLEGLAEYNNQIKKWNKRTISSKNSKGGLRIFSLSDADPRNMIDMIQIVTDSAEKGLMIQGYTKKNWFARFIKDTGVRILRSHIPAGNGVRNGKLVFDNVEGINTNDPDYFDATNERNIGDTVIGINDEMIRIAMLDPNIDQIIPFHTQLAKDIRDQKKIGHWTPYNGLEDRNVSDGKKADKQINIYKDVLQAWEKKGTPIKNRQEFVEAFLQVCDERGLIPRFDKFLNVDENGKYVYTPGYEKFLVDYKLFDRTTGEIIPQEAVKPIFDDAYNQSVLENYVKGAKNLPKVSEDVFDEIKRHFTDDKLSLPKAESKQYAKAEARWETGEKLTESQFYSFYSAHKLDLRRQGNVLEQIESIKRDGFKGTGGFTGNLMPTRQIVRYPTRDKYNMYLELEKEGVFPKGKAEQYKSELGDEYGRPEPSNASEAKYGPRKGEYILLVPKPGSDKNQDRVKPGYKPRYGYEIVQADYDYQPYYEMYSKAYDAQSKKQYAISKSDTAYLKAVESGNMKKAQRMVDKAAKETGYTIKAYHATVEDFTEFSREEQGKTFDGGLAYGAGFYFAPSENDAKYWQKTAEEWGAANEKKQTEPGMKKIMSVYLKTDSILNAMTPVKGGAEYLMSIGVSEKLATLASKNGWSFIRYLRMEGLTNAEIQGALKSLGYDAVDATSKKLPGDYGKQFIVFDPEQIKSADPVTYDDDGEPIPLSERFNPENKDIRYAISKDATLKSDTAYLKAVESDDMETAQRMVDEAARKAGYRTLAYHGSPKNNIHIFDGWNGVSYFTNDERYAKGYAWGSENGNIIRRSKKAKRQLDNRFTTDVTGMPDSFDVFDSVAVPEDYDGEPGKFFADGNTDAIYYAEDVDKYGDLTYKQVAGWHTVYDETTGTLRVEKGVGEAEEEYRNEKQHMIDAGNGVERPKVYRAYLKMENPYISRHPLDGNRFSARFNDGDTEYSEKSIKRLNELKDAGYDGVIVMSDAAMMNALAGEEDNAEDVLDYVVFDPTQIKSADPVTYDDSGKPIPLSERFNPENKDIRYAISKDATLNLPSVNDRAVYIKDSTDANGNPVSFVDLILDGQKLGETRNTRNLPVGEWVGISKGGKNPTVVGRVIFGDPIRITNQSPEYADAHIKGTGYDLKDGESKWYYPIEQVEDFRDNPRKMTSNAPVMGRYQYAINKDATIRTESELIDSVIDPKETAKAGVENALDGYLDSIGAGSDIPGMDKISTGTKRNAKLPAKYKAQDAARFFYRKMVDSGEAVTRLGRYSNDPHLYHYYNMARASSNAAVSMIQDAQTDVMGRRVGDSLNDIFSAIRKKGEQYYADLQAYLYHTHNIDRMSRANPGAIASAQVELEQFRHDNPELANMADFQIERLANDPISFYHDQARAYMQILRRLQQASTTHNKPVFGQDVTAEQSRRAAEDLREKLSETEGFEEDVEKIYAYIDNLMQYRIDSGLITEEEYQRLKEIYPHYVPTFREQEPAARNKRGNTTEIGKTVGRAQGGDTRLIPLHRALAQQTFSVVREGSKNRFGQMLLEGKQNNSRGMIKNVEEAEGGFHEDTFDEEDPTPTKENTFIVRQGGKRYEIGMDNALYESVTALSPEPSETNFLINMVHKSNDLFKALCTGYNPTFLVRNFMRDLQDAGLYSKDLSEFSKNYPLAYKEIATNGKYWQMYKALGGLYSSFFDYQTGELKQSGKVKKYTVDAIESVNMAVEQAPRLAEFMATVKKAEKAGNLSMDTLMEAIYNAADVTVNFGRSGKWGKMFNRSVVPFFNPGVQGFDKMIRNVTETKGFKDWARLAAKATILGIAPAVISRLLFGKRKDWDEIKQRDKDIYYLFPLQDGVWLKLPKGRVLSVFGMAADRAMQGKDADWASFIETSLTQTAPENPLTASYWRPWLDAKLFDKDDPGKTWYGSDIENQRLRNLAPGQRYDTSTDALSKWLGETFNLSPKKINYLLDQYSGVIGDVLLPLTSDRAEKGLFTNAFTIDSVVSNQLSEDFYDMKDRLTWAKNDPNATGEDEALYKYWNEQTSAISDINKAIRAIEQDKSLTDKEKRDLTRVQYSLRNGIMRNALDSMKDYRAGGTDNDIYSMVSDAQAQEERESKIYSFKGQDVAWDDLSGTQKKIVQAQDAIDNDPNADLSEIIGKGNATKKLAQYQAARDQGISNQTYIDALQAIDDADDGNGNYNQAEAKAGLDKLISDGTISEKEAGTIWKIITGGADKNNPFPVGAIRQMGLRLPKIG